MAPKKQNPFQLKDFRGVNPNPEVDYFMENDKTIRNIAVEWDAAIQVDNSKVRGRVEITHGRLAQAEIEPGQGSSQDGQFTFAAGRRTRLCLAIAEARLGSGRARYPGHDREQLPQL